MQRLKHELAAAYDMVGERAKNLTNGDKCRRGIRDRGCEGPILHNGNWVDIHHKTGGTSTTGAEMNMVGADSARRRAPNSRTPQQFPPVPLLRHDGDVDDLSLRRHQPQTRNAPVESPRFLPLTSPGVFLSTRASFQCNHHVDDVLRGGGGHHWHPSVSWNSKFSARLNPQCAQTTTGMEATLSTNSAKQTRALIVRTTGMPNLFKN